ncbi:MAG: secondary thiamine-phosphate synthase enzyme YjbQ [Candidatus Tritonobacter lacicola]|nr:secondary thiamine-phosphate synthase enzyme YjbQ [Candidatus Tritonobacter lacicola]
MDTFSHTIRLSTGGNTDVFDITPFVRDALESSGLSDGIAVVSTVGSTSAITTCEYEPGLEKDLKDIFEKLVPRGGKYAHNSSWGGSDGNAHSHLRASLVGPSVTLIVENGRLLLGTWQQIIFIDFDNRPRERTIRVKLLGS